MGNYVADVDECQGVNGCQHQCSNTLGGYRCKCDSGFRLDLADRRSCIRTYLDKNQYNNLFLFFFSSHVSVNSDVIDSIELV